MNCCILCKEAYKKLSYFAFFWQAELFQEFLGNASFFGGYCVLFLNLQYCICVSMYLYVFSSRKFFRKQP